MSGWWQCGRIESDAAPVPVRHPFAPAEVAEFYRSYYGPTHRAIAALDASAPAALSRDLEQLRSEHNLASDGTTCYDAEYFEVDAIRK